MHRLTYHVLVCNGGCCHREGGEHLLQMFRREVTRLNGDHIRITETRCTGRCVDSCSVVVYPQGVWYRNVTQESVHAIVQGHLFRGEIQQELVSYTYQLQNFIEH
ncbi:(2Fe-2S) ferredoxin domain-containing protein [Alicyclobacillus fastidiosus]|uniref:(2Fe-2S) ferredoxin domain-containing protein n=2 Tax=Alicyclobacillus fastidiosus TaxID=392011 RepID=A0ABV5ALE5_9BACL|nr:(2Fe-2S) ferredoxin domain-containing protein [Alicyclobacillus fastidiosus]WEH12015.1 (2Fe-2S) ferredoxin domain-containing protein [Alicyclobacillus fastidiosus]